MSARALLITMLVGAYLMGGPPILSWATGWNIIACALVLWVGVPLAAGALVRATEMLFSVWRWAWKSRTTAC